MQAGDLTLELQDTIYFRFTQLFPAAYVIQYDQKSDGPHLPAKIIY